MAKLVYVVVEHYGSNFNGLEAFSTKKKARAHIDKRVEEVVKYVGEDRITENCDVIRTGYGKVLSHKLTYSESYLGSCGYDWTVYEKEI